jgi:hypothetical protein
VEKTFGSIHEVYRYKLGRLPRADPDEHMKLAHWCLSQGLNAEATAQLEQVLALHRDHAQARAMLQNLAVTARRAAPSDPEVSRTGRHRHRPHRGPGPGPARELNSDVLAQIRRDQGQVPPAKPVIFDLPPAQAVRRFQEFAGSVHPELQRHCAKCHNERSDRQFQIVEAKSRRDLSNHLLVTTNLDATLRLIDPENPAKSEVLVSAVMPHGPANRPILSGPNDPSYQRLATWIHSLKGPQRPVAAATASAPLPTSSPDGSAAFASERPPSPAREVPTPAAPTIPVATAPPRDPSETPRISATHPAVPPDADSGPLPCWEGPIPPGGGPRAGPLARRRPAARCARPAATPGTITLPSGEVVPVDTRALSKKDPADPAGAPRKKPVTVDPGPAREDPQRQGRRAEPEGPRAAPAGTCPRGDERLPAPGLMPIRLVGIVRRVRKTHLLQAW